MRIFYLFAFTTLFGIFTIKSQVTFYSPKTIEAVTTGGYSLELGDFYGNGKDNIVYSAEYSDKVFWYEYNGDNNFTGHYLESNDPTYVELVDLNGDNIKDLVVFLNTSNCKIVWYPSLGNGSFGNEQVIGNDLDNRYPTYLIVHDIDSDNDLDIIAMASYYNGGSSAYLYFNQGNNTFAGNEVLTESPGFKIVFNDIDNDGDEDMLIGRSDDVYIYANDGNTVFTFVKKIEYYVPWLNDFVVADFDDDGKDDVVTCHFVSQGDINFYKNYGNYNFLKTTVNSFSRARNIEVADIDNDGDLDFSVIQIDEVNFEDHYTLFWYENTQGTFTHEIINHQTNGYFKIGDIDGDLDNDIAIIADHPYPDSDYIVWCENNLNNIFVIDTSFCNGDSLYLNISDMWVKTSGVYYDTVYNSNGGINVSIITLEVLDLPPDFEIVGLIDVSQGQVVNYFVDENNEVTYLWEILNGEIINMPLQNSVTIQWADEAGEGKISVNSSYPDGCSKSKEIFITIGPDAINQNNYDNMAIIYPNPVTDKLYISKDYHEDITLLISNLHGKFILRSTESEVDISFLSPGIYFVEIKNNKGETIFSEKLLKL
ncbi:MAG: T9SS type A sorting domain-containing protein [Bacteroidales bacterium]|nr:T9SS type A sorting domain-containing protein [Bacteroidales bacterium]